MSNAKQKIISSKLPHNLLTWSVTRDAKLKTSRFGTFDLTLTAKDIDDELSGNPYKTAKCFLLLGIDLESVPNFVNSKEQVNSVVAKRNNIIHHNYTATDISLGDIRAYSSQFKVYVKAIAEAVRAINHS